jgi:IS5 family transposase
MDALIPWQDLLRLIEPHYPKPGNGRQPLGLEKMLRIDFAQLHIGAETKGRVHSVIATNAATADITPLDELRPGEETTLYGDQAYWKEADRQDFKASGMRYRVNRRPPGKQPLSEPWRRINRARSRIRARGEHPFHVVKRLWGFTKVRYRGLTKTLARAQTMFALANLYSVRHQLMPAGARCALHA